MFTQNRRSRSSSKRHHSETNYREVITELAAHPVVRYMATGVATVLLAQLARKARNNYPEISQFIHDSVGMFETNMADMRYQMEEGFRERH